PLGEQTDDARILEQDLQERPPGGHDPAPRLQIHGRSKRVCLGHERAICGLLAEYFWRRKWSRSPTALERYPPARLAHVLLSLRGTPLSEERLVVESLTIL